MSGRYRSTVNDAGEDQQQQQQHPTSVLGIRDDDYDRPETPTKSAYRGILGGITKLHHPCHHLPR
jgi:hypothetical protein